MTTNFSNEGSAISATVVHGDIKTIHYSYNAPPPEHLKMAKKVLFGYYESWAEYKTNPIEKFSLEDIKVDKVTHVAYAYIKINDDGSVNLGDDENYTKSQRFLQFLHLKNRNPEIKLLISLGGWMENQNIFQEVFSDESKLYLLFEGIKKLIQQFDFDGLDVVWIYPQKQHKDIFTNFFAKLRAFCPKLFGSPFILSAVISPASPIADVYDFRELTKHLDFFNILSYNFFTGESCTQHNAPMERIKSLARELMKERADFKKVLLGVELGGKKFKLKNPLENQPGAECDGDYELIKSFEISDHFQTGEWKTVLGPSAGYAYSFCGNQWISHENEKTVRSKAKFASEYNMAGVVMMALNYEGNAESPLLDAIYKELNE